MIRLIFFNRGIARPIWSALLLLLFFVEAAWTQVVFDGTVGAGGSGVAPGSEAYTYEVDSTRGEQAGGNLFHSFSEFSVDPSENVGFAGPGLFDHVFVRLTGESPALINGSVFSEHVGADLYFLSPHGITVGPSGAFYNLSGGLTLSTANAVRFSDGAFPVDGSPWSASGCCSGEPVSLVFEGTEGDAPLPGVTLTADPSIPGFVGVGSFNAFRIVAGKVGLISRKVEVPGSVIHLVATGHSAVEVPLSVGGESNLPLAQVGQEALIELEGSRLDSRMGGGAGGGRVLLEGGVLRLVGGTEIYSGGNAQGPAMDLKAGHSMTLEASTLKRFVDEGLVSGPAIRISAPEVLLAAGNEGVSLIESSAAPVEIRGETVSLTGGSSVNVIGLQTEGLNEGSSGSPVGLHVVGSEEVSLDEGSVLFSLPRPGGGPAGAIWVEGGNLRLVNGGQIRTPVYRDLVGGDIRVDMAGSVVISGVLRSWEDGAWSYARSGLLARALYQEGSALTFPGAKAGDISVRAGSLEVTQGGTISASTLQTPADTGSVDVRLEGDLLVSGSLSGQGSEIAARADDGASGSVFLQAENISIVDGGFVTVSSLGEASAGELNVMADHNIFMRDAELNAEALAASEGGEITIAAGARIEFIRSKVETKVSKEDGSGGNIRVGQEGGPQYLVLNESELVSSAKEGSGGNIDLSADYLLESADSAIIPSSFDGGVDGVVTINAPQVDVAGQVEPLPVSYLDVSALLRAQCAARRDVGDSSFVIEGRPSRPPALDGYLPSGPRGVSSEGATSQTLSPQGGSVRQQLDGFDPGCGGRWRLADRD